MTQKNQIYKCNICGNIVEVINPGDGELVCCGKPMELLTEKNEDQGKEKHVPIMEKNGNGVIVKVGEIPHPMETAHYIEWIEIITENKKFRKFLKPGEEPLAKFTIDEEILAARIYCNIHGLWKNK